MRYDKKANHNADRNSIRRGHEEESEGKKGHRYRAVKLTGGHYRSIDEDSMALGSRTGGKRGGR